MFGHGDKANWQALREGAEILPDESRAALDILRSEATKLPKGESAALAGLLADQIGKNLQILADRKACPAIADEKIERPIVIIGMPRSGTSLLHALLAADPHNRTPRNWQLMTPSPPAPDATETSRRIAHAAEAVSAFLAATPEMLKLHPYWDEAGNTAIECEDIMQLSLISPYFPAFFRLLEYDSWLATADHRPAYRAHHAFLQHLQWRTPSRRWVLKGVAHIEHLDLLLETYPDACLVWPHRDPIDQIASMCSIVAVTRRVNEAEGLEEIRRCLVENVSRGLEAALAHPASRDGRILHIPFSRLNREPQEIVAQIYARLGTTISPAHERAMSDWLSAPQNDPNRYGRVSSDLERFGSSIKDMQDKFAAYIASGFIPART
jgi:hypothetical protein